MMEICYKAEKAFWYFEDNYIGNNKVEVKKRKEEFLFIMFKHIPYLRPWDSQEDFKKLQHKGNLPLKK
jgi:hypothetical protein